MLVKTYTRHDFTIFYFDKYGTYSDLVDAINSYIDAGTTSYELFFFDSDARFITPEQVKKIATVAAKAAKVRAPGGKTALMYGRVSLYGLGRIYKVVEAKIIDKNWSTRVFKKLDEALDWLNISEKLITETIKESNVTEVNTKIPYLRE